MKKVSLISMMSLLLILAMLGPAVAANANLFVSSEESNLVVEVVIIDSDINDTDEAKEEPDVTVKGKDLRMVQATDGKWYGYFANLESAKLADQNALNRNTDPKIQSFDFGIFCGPDTAAGILGDDSALGDNLDFTYTQGFALPRSEGITDGTQGTADFKVCTGSPLSSPILNNVVKDPQDINTDPNVPIGQIGLDPDAWPLVQLYTFVDGRNIDVQYNKGGGAQTATLAYTDPSDQLIAAEKADAPEGPVDSQLDSQGTVSVDGELVSDSLGVDVQSDGGGSSSSTSCILKPGQVLNHSTHAILIFLGFIIGIIFLRRIGVWK